MADQPQSKPDTASDDRTDTTELDLDIVSDTFRAFVDQAAFDSLIERWNQKLNALDSEASILERHFSTAFFKQMDVAADTLDRLDAQIFEDPLEKVVAEVAGPAVVISPDLRVASVNVEGSSRLELHKARFCRWTIFHQNRGLISTPCCGRPKDTPTSGRQLFKSLTVPLVVSLSRRGLSIESIQSG